VISQVTLRGGPDGDDEQHQFYLDIESAWRDAGIEMLDVGRMPEVVHGVPAMAIGGRMRGGAGGGIEHVAAQVFVTLWPLAAAGYVGAASADAWVLTKHGISAALKTLFHRGVAEVTIRVADDREEVVDRDDSFHFDAEDASDIDRVVEAMATKERARAVIEERTSTEYYWDPQQGDWVPERQVRSTRRITTDDQDAPPR
jgi:hypothetical protein